jgi:hypothetical protein
MTRELGKPILENFGVRLFLSFNDQALGSLMVHACHLIQYKLAKELYVITWVPGQLA